MASNHTENYGLSLWEPGDPFVREEFNGDHQKLDEAVASAARQSRTALDRLADVGYNTCQLALQHYYDGKETEAKRAMLFDGFLDGSMIASKSDALVLSGGALTLSRSIGSPQDVANGSGYQFASFSVDTAGPVAAPGGAYLYRLLCVWRSKTDPEPNKSLDFNFMVNGKLHHSEVHRLSFTTETQSDYITLSRPIPVAAGDQVYFECVGLSTYLQMPVVRDSQNSVYAVYGFRPLSDAAALLTSRAVELPESGGVRAWVRHSGGAVDLSVVTGGETVEMEHTGSRAAVNLQGQSCTEAAFRLDKRLPAGETAIQLAVEADGSAALKVFDYGVILV